MNKWQLDWWFHTDSGCNMILKFLFECLTQNWTHESCYGWNLTVWSLVANCVFFSKLSWIWLRGCFVVVISCWGNRLTDGCDNLFCTVFFGLYWYCYVRMARGRFELPTRGFSVHCSTYWAIWPGVTIKPFCRKKCKCLFELSEEIWFCWHSLYLSLNFLHLQCYVCCLFFSSWS